MSDLPEGLSESFFFQHESGRQVELLNYRRYPDIDFVRKKSRKRKRLPGSFREKRSSLVQRDGMLCHYCECEMIHHEGGGKLPQNALTIEHIVPRSHDGSNRMFNLVLACNKCNNDLGNKYHKCNCNFCESARYRRGEEDETQ